MGVISITGSLICGPTTGNDGFPASQDTIPFAATPDPKASTYKVNGIRKVNTVLGTYVVLDGLGPVGTLTLADTCFLQTDSPILVRKTMQNPQGGPDIVSVETLQGMDLHEYGPSGTPGGLLKLVEVSGVAIVDYLFSGNQ